VGEDGFEGDSEEEIFEDEWKMSEILDLTLETKHGSADD